jgi:hypothetical protein
MNILTDALPTQVTVGGEVCPINTEFYVGVQFELLMQDPDKTHREKVAEALDLYYPRPPRDLEGGIEQMLWFYRCGAPRDADDEAGETKAPAPTPKKAYDFEQDGDLIFAAFYEAYGIDLTETDLHWWKFRALFAGLPSTCAIKTIMGYRTADLKGLSKGQKKHYEKMRKLFALKNMRTVESTMTLEERDRRMKAYVDRRFEEMNAQRG